MSPQTRINSAARLAAMAVETVHGLDKIEANRVKATNLFKVGLITEQEALQIVRR